LGGEDLWPKLQASISAGRPYDIVTNGYVGQVCMLADQNRLEPLDDIIAKFGKDDFLPKILFEYKGKVWWFPYDYNPGFLYIRTDLFKEKNLKPPKTWNEMIAVSKALTEKERYGVAYCIGENGCNSLLWSPILWGNGVELFDRDWKVILDSPQMKPKAVEALNHWKELYRYMPSGMEAAGYAEMLSFFATGRVAIGVYAGRLVHYMKDKSPELLDKFQVIGFPTKDGRKGAVGFGYDGFIVPKGPNSKAAKEFVLWFAENKMAEFNAALAVHLLPTQKSIYNNPKYREHPDSKRFWDAAIKPQYDLVSEGILGSVDTQGPHPDPRPGEVLNAGIIKDMAQSVVLKKVLPEQAIDEAAMRMREIMKK
jgi:multiple sugar transport system substrate-binding protein